MLCVQVDHLIKDYDYHAKKIAQHTTRNHAHRGNHKQYAQMTHHNPQKHMVPAAVLTQSKPVSITAIRPGNLQHALKDKRVIDSGCSRHMTRNMSYLSDFDELNGGYVAFGGNPKGGKISGKKEKSRQSIVPSGDLTCLFLKETIDESNLWHRRLGHINFKTMNKLVKGNLGRGLPTNVFKNDNTCVACKKGKQHRASCKTKHISSVDQPLYRLHMDLFGPTFVKSLNKKSYCLVVIDDYSRFTWVFFLATKDDTSPILKTFITGLENQLSLKVKVIRSDNGTEFKNHDLNQFYGIKGIQVLVTKPHNKTPYELLHGRTPSIGFMRPFGYPVTILNTLDSLGKFDGKVDEGFQVGYSVSSKAFRVFNSRTRIVQEILHVNFLENKPNVTGFQDKFTTEKAGEEIDQQYVLFPVWSSGFTNPQNNDGDAAFDGKEPDFDEKKPESEVNVSPRSSAQSRKQDDKTKKEDKGKSHVESFTGYRYLKLEDITYSDDEDDVGAEADFNNLETSILASPIPTSRIHKHHHVTQIIGDLSLTTQTRSISKVVKYQGGTPEGTSSSQRSKGKIDETLFIKRQKEDILLVQIYVDDIISGETNKDLCKSFEKLMKDKFQMSSIGELTLFLGLQVKQKKDGIFISQDKYVAEILRKFGLTEGKSASTPIDSEKPLLKDPNGEDVDVHTYRLMIGSLMYLTSSRPDIMFAVCACARFQVTPKASHLHAVKRIFRYLKGKPCLGLWYPKDSPFDLVAYSNSNYAGASLDIKSTTRGCQFLGCRLISWQCKKQTIVATSSTEVEYVAAASCYVQVLWIQNQLLNY
nr:uncharacterized mitochondrial protein AtMg00810-like [Tanacetum cinerariifolium]